MRPDAQRRILDVTDEDNWIISVVDVDGGIRPGGGTALRRRDIASIGRGSRRLPARRRPIEHASVAAPSAATGDGITAGSVGWTTVNPRRSPRTLRPNATSGTSLNQTVRTLQRFGRRRGL